MGKTTSIFAVIGGIVSFLASLAGVITFILSCITLWRGGDPMEQIKAAAADIARAVERLKPPSARELSPAVDLGHKNADDTFPRGSGENATFPTLTMNKLSSYRNISMNIVDDVHPESAGSRVLIAHLVLYASDAKQQPLMLLDQGWAVDWYVDADRAGHCRIAGKGSASGIAQLNAQDIETKGSELPEIGPGQSLDIHLKAECERSPQVGERVTITASPNVMFRNGPELLAARQVQFQGTGFVR